MTPEEHNAAIRSTFANDNNIPHNTELKQALGKNRLVQPINTDSLHDAASLIYAYSKNGCPGECEEYLTVEYIDSVLQWGYHPSEDLDYSMKALQKGTL